MARRGAMKKPRRLVKSIDTFVSKMMMRTCTGRRIG